MPALLHTTGTVVECCYFQSSWIVIVCQYKTGIFKVSLLKLQLDWKRGNYFPSMLPEAVHLSTALKLCLFCGLVLKVPYWTELICIFSWIKGKPEMNVIIRFISWEWQWGLFWTTEMWKIYIFSVLNVELTYMLEFLRLIFFRYWTEQLLESGVPLRISHVTLHAFRLLTVSRNARCMEIERYW